MLKGRATEFLAIAWTFIASHWPAVLTVSSAVKSVADAIDSVKKLLPPHLESKELTQDYLDTSMATLNDQSKSVEDKKWELTTRQELVKSLVQLTAIDAAYHIASATVLGAFCTALLHLLWRIILRRREL